MNISASREHYLLTALGTSPIQTTYALDTKTESAESATLALLRLLPQDTRPDVVLCLLTPTARERVWEGFRRQVEELEIDVCAVDIPEGDSAQDVADIVQTAADIIEAGSRLTLDITHGPRHIPFVLYALALYLSSLKDVSIDAAWYGKYQSDAKAKPLINLRSLLDFPQWFYSVKLFRETGFTSDLANRFMAVRQNLPEGPERGPPGTVNKALDDFSKAYESGLPLELGLAAGKLCHTLESQPLRNMQGLAVPQAQELSGAIDQATEPFRFEPEALRNGQAKGEWKKTVALSKAELHRQAGLIDRYIERGQIALALGMMREWVVSLGVLHKGKADDWLERGARMRVERQIGALSQPALRDRLSENQQAWGSFWDQLGKQRNQIAHCGMKPEVATPSLDSIKGFWNDIKRADNAWAAFGGGAGRLLLTPLGMSPGVLYSAIKKTQPVSVLVLCSEQAQAELERALREAGFAGSHEVLVMQDPFNGFEEIGGLRKRARTILFSADEVMVNLTGGTTMMGIAVQSIFEQARDDQRPCRRFVLTDKRPVEAQKSDPWVESDLFWLDPDPDEGNDDD
jgi:CRISPR-associated DxTHG motif protein